MLLILLTFVAIALGYVLALAYWGGLTLLRPVLDVIRNKRQSSAPLELVSQQAEVYPTRTQLPEPVLENAGISRNRTIVGLLIVGMVFASLCVLAATGHTTFPSIETFPEVSNDPGSLELFLGKLTATILVYMMQFGFIAFEAGAVRRNYRRQSAVKNLIVFAIAFMAYEFFGWKIQHAFNPQRISSLLDVAFNAGFASTVSLIVANTITERGTLLVNSVSSMATAGLAYPLAAGLLFDGGILSTLWGFVDTAGGCVVHVLGAAFGLCVAFMIGPRSIRQAWYLLGRVEIGGQRDNTLRTIGAFFLWFGWLGFNSGSVLSGASPKVWTSFLVAFTNTSIGASVGGVFGLVVAVANMGVLRTMDTRDLTSGGDLREISHLERVVLGMMGGLVAVTANASRVEPLQAVVEAMLGAFVAMVGSALIVRHAQKLDDPLGAIATHGLAGAVGVLCTGLFRRDVHTAAFPHGHIYSVGVQALGLLIATGIGLALAYFSCASLLALERSRIARRLRLNGPWLRLTSYEEQTGKISTEFWVPEDDRAQALNRVRSGPPKLVPGGDQGWIEAVRVLALSDQQSEESNILLAELDKVLESSYEGRPEEQTALAAIAAVANVARLPMCVRRALAHRDPGRYPELGAVKWEELDPLYTETLVVSMSELAESFAMYEAPFEQPHELRQSFRDAYTFLESVAEKKEPGIRLWKIALAHLGNLEALSSTRQILQGA